MSGNAPTIDPGKVRSFQRVVSPDGFFLICAFDHLDDFQELIDPDLSRVTFEATVAAKLEVIHALVGQVSAFLLDPRFSIGQAIAAGALPPTKGFMSAIEDQGYYGSDFRMTKFRVGWSTRKVKLIGADICKLLWFYRPDSDSAAHQRRLLKSIIDECTSLSLPLVVEPIWYPLPGEDPKDPAWKADRVEGILTSAFEAANLGIDMLKVEFPGYVDTAEGREKAAEACRRLDAGIDIPWVILSAGVTHETFKTQLEIACKAGASGYLAGRSVWRDAAGTRDPKAREAAFVEAATRLAELNAITRAHGRPYRPNFVGAALHQALPDLWYEGWHP